MQALILMVMLTMILAACEPASQLIVPTDPPTQTPTFTPSPTRTPGGEVTPTRRPTQIAQIGGASPTPLLGASRTPIPPDFPTPTRPFDPNAPQIEFFTSDPLTITPGEEVRLFWSARNVDNAAIYRLDGNGNRSQVFNVAPDGNLLIDTVASDRGELAFTLVVGDGADERENTIVIPLQCPVDWFFAPAPEDCASGAPVETLIVDQEMERGRMLYIQETDVIYVLFNDGQQPAWSSFQNRYDPAIHAERDPNAPPEFIQPLAELGFVWRGNDTVRTRLGLGLRDAFRFDGFIQRAPGSGSADVIYISGGDGIVLQLLPGNEIWQIITSG